MRRFAALLLFLPVIARADILYTVTPEPANKSVLVRMELEANSDSTSFRIPAWCPGYYVIQDYQKKLSDVKVTDAAGKTLTCSQPDIREWKVASKPGDKLVLSYRVLGDDPGLGFFGVSVKSHTVFINGPAAFMYLPNRLEEKVRVRFSLPQKWDVATAIEKTGDAEWTAEGYDELADHPIQLGLFERRAFKSEGIAFEAIFVSENQTYRANLDEEAKQLSELSRPAIKMMRDVPFKKFLYIIHLSVGDFSGGLEHRSSTVLAVSNASQLRLHELATHEFYHAWNVKQIRPKALGPFDYTQKVRVPGIWFSEGVTDYYAHLHSYQAGFRDAETMIGMLGGQIAELQESQTRKSKTLEDASKEAWENGSIGTGDLSYYTKGSVAGLVFDAAIRSETDGAKSLDDVMRLLYARHKLPKPGFEDDGILKAINEVAGSDLSDLYRKVVRSTEEMPYEVLQSIGLRWRTPGQSAYGLGFSLKDGVVAALDDAMHRQGLRRGDRVLLVNDTEFADGCFASIASNQQYSLAVSRGGEKVRLDLKAVPMRTAYATLEIDPFATERAERLRAGWLKKPY